MTHSSTGFQQAPQAAAADYQQAAALATQERNWPALQKIAAAWTTTQPASVDAWQVLSRSHFEQSEFDQALAAFQQVLVLAPEHLVHQISAARLATAAQQYNKARHWLEDAQQKAADAPALLAGILYPLARVYQLTGDLALAENCCRRSLDANPGYPPAYSLLGTLTEGRLSDTEIHGITALLQRPDLHAEYRAMLGFTLGDALDRRGEYAAAFAAWQSANTINQHIYAQEGIAYQRQAVQDEYDWLAEIFAVFNSSAVQANNRNQTLQPIFVVGMPRSGTTLAESILASHSQVIAAGELPTLCAIHDELLDVARQHGTKAARATLIEKLTTWRQRYLDALPAPTQDKSDAAYVVDKQPLNFRSIGLIRALFPEAAIIYTQRPAIDIGFSIYRHNFTKNWPCAHRLDDIAHYLQEHNRLMSLWQQYYPQAIHVLDHLALIQQPELEIKRLLDFAGLSFEAACLAPHNTQRPIATFSAVQVRKPLSAAYSGRAAHYLPWLSALG